MKQTLKQLTAVLTLGLTLAQGARAELVIEISEGVLDPVPIAVVPFGWAGQGEVPFDVAQLIEANLERSGRFDGMPRNVMLERPTEARDIDFQDWRLIGIDVVIIGRMLPLPTGEIDIQFQVFDVFRNEQLLGYAISSTRELMRPTAHRISDMIYEALTGEPGVFSTRIAYVAVESDAEGDRFQLLVADADGENEQMIAESRSPIMSPAWSPSGKFLAYVGFENHASAVHVQHLSTGHRQTVSARPGVNGAPAWSPDARHLAVALSDPDDGNVDIYRLNVQTGNVQRLTDNPAIDTEPAWSADGRTIFFTSDRAGGPQVYRVGVNGGNPSRVTFEGPYNARPRLSPDERLVAVVHNDGGNYRIAVVDLESRTTQVLTDGRLDESPSFAPNGSMILYATREGNAGVLAAVSVDGRVRQKLVARRGEVREPAWSPFPPRDTPR